VTSHDNTTRCTATFDNLSVTPFPAPWQSLDIGAPGVQGSGEYFNGAFAVKGGGSIGGTADNFQYVYQSLGGDGQIVARVKNAGSGACAGVMIRDGLVSGSMYAYVGVNGTGAYQWLGRAATGGNSISVAGATGFAPNLWVKLVRTGNVLTGSSSPD